MPSIERPPTVIGCTIPSNTPHAVSVTLPSWKANIAYEEGAAWVVDKMKSGYPRFFYHEKIKQLITLAESLYGHADEKALIFPSYKVACKCRTYMNRFIQTPDATIRVVEIAVPPPSKGVSSNISIVFFPTDAAALAKSFWQHTGDGISSRQAEYCLEQLKAKASSDVLKAEPKQENFKFAPHSFKRYAKRMDSPPVTTSEDESDDSREFSTFVEERFGRNLDISFVRQVKVAVRRRIAGTLDGNMDISQINSVQPHESTRDVEGLTEDDVFLYPTGMSSIFNAHQTLLSCMENLKSVCFGFPYIDTLKILQKWGPGCHFYGNGEPEDLVALEKLLESGERIMALFCEFPSNPLLKCPNLKEIRRLADKYNFAVVVDETIGNFKNIHVLEYADIVVSSLTKIFSGDSNVMGGSLVLSPASKYYNLLKKTMATEYEDNMWAEDAIFLERNSRDFESRIDRINVNAEALCELLVHDPKIKQVFYPKFSSTRQFYDDCRTENGGYGGLLSIIFYDPENARKFFDRISTAKGPSLGTNFTLLCPYTILAHFVELEWAKKYGVDESLIRISVGLEPTAELVANFKSSLDSLD
ncbi:pyridoxal phosphate-dependent transferase, partial [Lipomyces oligophaga]|uniref:pyridoxal phosphate-dependent transferase n=1 Tax=Lipomyces oligophaga TaxID=45792 RepID=UPI0034CE9D76